jgi:hypothetical protein
MKVARAIGFEAMKENNVELLPAPPIERRVLIGGFLVLKVLVKVVSDLDITVEPFGSSNLYVRLFGITKA